MSKRSKHAALPQIIPAVGEFQFEDGSTYQGMYNDNLTDNSKTREGKGECKSEEGVYIGDWVNDAMEGNGQYTSYATKETYSGSFKNNLYDGFGKYIFMSGSFYEGEWREGRMHGKGIFVDDFGEKWGGSFKEGVYDAWNEWQPNIANSGDARTS